MDRGDGCGSRASPVVCSVRAPARGQPQLPDLTALGFFVFGLVATVVAGPGLFQRYSLVILWLAFTATGWGSMVLGAPFALQYARESAPPESRDALLMWQACRFITGLVLHLYRESRDRSSQRGHGPSAAHRLAGAAWLSYFRLRLHRPLYKEDVRGVRRQGCRINPNQIPDRVRGFVRPQTDSASHASFGAIHGAPLRLSRSTSLSACGRFSRPPVEYRLLYQLLVTRDAGRECAICSVASDESSA